MKNSITIVYEWDVLVTKNVPLKNWLLSPKNDFSLLLAEYFIPVFAGPKYGFIYHCALLFLFICF